MLLLLRGLPLDHCSLISTRGAGTATLDATREVQVMFTIIVLDSVTARLEAVVAKCECCFPAGKAHVPPHSSTTVL